MPITCRAFHLIASRVTTSAGIVSRMKSSCTSPEWGSILYDTSGEGLIHSHELWVTQNGLSCTENNEVSALPLRPVWRRGCDRLWGHWAPGMVPLLGGLSNKSCGALIRTGWSHYQIDQEYFPESPRDHWWRSGIGHGWEHYLGALQP